MDVRYSFYLSLFENFHNSEKKTNWDNIFYACTREQHGCKISLDWGKFDVVRWGLVLTVKVQKYYLFF